MKPGMPLFLTGLVLFLGSIFLSARWAIIGTVVGILGGLAMGAAMYFLASNAKRR